MKHTLWTIAAIAAFNACTAQTTAPHPYCYPVDNGAVVGGAILSVNIGTLNNVTGSTPTNYQYYDNVAAPVLFKDSTYLLTIYFDSICHTGSCAGTVDNSWYRICIPFTTSVTSYTSFFTPIAYDTIGSLYGTIAPVSISFAITVPHDAEIGKTRLRISRYGWLATYTGCTPRLCNTGNPSGHMGETEDYDLDIRGAESLGISNISKNELIYPNPTTGIINVPVGKTTITDIIGKVAYSGTDTQINLTGSASGIYIAYVNNIPYRIRKY